MRTRTTVVAVVALLLATGAANADVFGTGDNQFTIDFVTISGSTNPASGYGIVNNDYRIGVYEVTNDQWTKFKSSVGVPVTGSPASGYDSDSYFTGMNVPTNNASWYEAAQFVNWLNTSTGHQAAYKFTGTQGSGDYALATWSTAEASGGTNLYRHKDAKYYLPTENEWVKAGHWNGASLQPYANASAGDLVPTPWAGVDLGRAAEWPDPTKWNYSPSGRNGPWNVGSGSQELNGTYDMMGNVWEWMESPISGDYGTDSGRGLRAGSYDYYTYYYYGYWGSIGFDSGYRNAFDPSVESIDYGFRIASEVPEPASLGLLILGGLTLLKRRRR